MSAYDWNLSAGAPLCELSDACYRTIHETIFQQLTKDTTPEQWQAAQESLLRLRDELVRDIRPMHYGALIGRHRCVDQVFKEARARLRGLEIMQPQPVPEQPAPPVPEPQEHSLEDVVETFETTDELFLGDTGEGDKQD
jgi:DNA-directed RNA polymerase specialized sigma24 family protein